MPVDSKGSFERDADGSKLRRIERVATTSDGHIEAYDKWNPVEGTTHGARLVDPKSGAVKMRTDEHESKTAAADWILRALGFVGMVGAVLIAVALIVVGMAG